MKLSDQAIATVMMALQKCIMEEKDITPMLKDLEFQMSDSEELIAMNPPVFNATEFFGASVPNETKETVGSD
tara:strand:- start:577 stop:792 length:216 start_codon:yes stop_codon:yes gene_type:complete